MKDFTDSLIEEYAIKKLYEYFDSVEINSPIFDNKKVPFYASNNFSDLSAKVLQKKSCRIVYDSNFETFGAVAMTDEIHDSAAKAMKRYGHSDTHYGDKGVYRLYSLLKEGYPTLNAVEAQITGYNFIVYEFQNRYLVAAADNNDINDFEKTKLYNSYIKGNYMNRYTVEEVYEQIRWK